MAQPVKHVLNYTFDCIRQAQSVSDLEQIMAWSATGSLYDAVHYLRAQAEIGFTTLDSALQKTCINSERDMGQQSVMVCACMQPPPPPSKFAHQRNALLPRLPFLLTCTCETAITDVSMFMAEWSI